MPKIEPAKDAGSRQYWDTARHEDAGRRRFGGVHEGPCLNTSQGGDPRPAGTDRRTRVARARLRGRHRRARRPHGGARCSRHIPHQRDVREAPCQPADRGLRDPGGGAMKFGVIRFPGSCDEVDALLACKRFAEGELLWHGDRDLRGADAIVIPGGFSYGDYLRAGAIARFSPVMEAVREFALDGGPVLGICNGFQVLCEAGLLPGALLPNTSLRFVCRQVELVVENPNTPFTRACDEGDRLSVPVKHTTGRYYATAQGLDELEADGHVLLRSAEGQNPNGSARDIAGVGNGQKNQFGLMPHPDPAGHRLTGSA